MKRRLFILMILLVLAVSLPLSVSADLIYEPPDEFCEEHGRECDHINRSHISNGPNGELTVYQSPEDSQILTVVPNRQSIYITHVCTASDGIDWGCVNLWEEDVIGWVPMPYVVLIYNCSDFRKEFKNRLEEESGDLSAFVGQEIRYWNYPGSEDCSTIRLKTPEHTIPDYHYIFVDDAGQKWGNIGFYQGIASSWVCLDNPTADYDTLYANHAPQQVNKPEIQPVCSDDVITPSRISSTTILITAAAVAAISAGLLVVLKKKKT